VRDGKLDPENWSNWDWMQGKIHWEKGTVECPPSRTVNSGVLFFTRDKNVPEWCPFNVEHGVLQSEGNKE